jgi:hypothetical protein
MYFEEMNATRDWNKKLKIRVKQLSEISRELKLEMKWAC